MRTSLDGQDELYRLPNVRRALDGRRDDLCGQEQTGIAYLVDGEVLLPFGRAVGRNGIEEDTDFTDDGVRCVLKIEVSPDAEIGRRRF